MSKIWQTKWHFSQKTMIITKSKLNQNYGFQLYWLEAIHFLSGCQTCSLTIQSTVR